MPWMRWHADERGLVVPVTMVLLALLFFAGTIMALAVESNLQTIGQIRTQDATHYAAESAVARGVAAVSARASSPPSGPWCGPQQPLVNGIKISKIDCSPAVGIGTAGVKQWAVSAPTLPYDIYLDFGDLGKTVSIWSVLGIRQLGPVPGKVNVRVDNPGGQPCLGSLPAGATYFACPSLKGKRTVILHMAGEGGPVSIGAFVIRAAEQGTKDFVVTVVGQAGAETDQADVLLPNGGKPVLGFWGSVLP